MVALRVEVIDGALQFIKKFLEPPLGSPAGLKELKEDVEIISSEENRGRSLAIIEDEVRSRIVMKLALYSIPSKPRFMRMPDRKRPCCLTETHSFLAICLKSNAESWSAGRYERVVPESAGPRNRWNREKINRSAQEAKRKAQEVIGQMSKEDKAKTEEDEKEIEKEVDGIDKKDMKREKEEKADNPSFAKEETRGDGGDRSINV